MSDCVAPGWSVGLHCRPSQFFAPWADVPSDGPARSALEPLLNGTDGILQYVAGLTAVYSTGHKWNEEEAGNGEEIAG